MSQATKVKICGIRDAAMAHLVATAGADYIGLVFVPNTPRVVTLAEAAVISYELAKQGSERPAVVGLFMNADPSEMRLIADEVCLDYFQLAGDEPLTMIHRLNRPIIKTLRCGHPQSVDELIREAQEWQQEGAMVLLDAPGTAGGHGKLADWHYALNVAQQQRVMLAGGLTPTNVAAAIQAVHPFAVDVSSGVERERGVKDATLVRQFINAAKGN